MKNNSNKEKTIKIKKLILTITLTVLSVIVSCTTCFATDGCSTLSNVYIYIMFIIVTAVAVAEGVYIAYLKIFKIKKDKDNGKKK